MTDPLTGEPVDVLWVKGSGGDIGSMKMDGFATLYLDKLHALKKRYRGLAHEDEMVGYFPHCTFNLNPRATSIDTPPHCFIPHRAHRPHARRRDDRVRRGEERRGADRRRSSATRSAGCPGSGPGFELGLKLRGAGRRRTRSMKGLILGSHGLVNWGDTSKECYERTLAHHPARRGLARRRTARPSRSARQVVAPLAEPSARRAFVARARAASCAASSSGDDAAR